VLESVALSCSIPVAIVERTSFMAPWSAFLDVSVMHPDAPNGASAARMQASAFLGKWMRHEKGFGCKRIDRPPAVGMIGTEIELPGY
jgi:hypothetical protein